MPGYAPSGDVSPMTLDDLFADRQAHTGPFIFSASDQALKGLKELRKICFVKANTVVFDIEATLLRVALPILRSVLLTLEKGAPNFDDGRLAIVVELQRIPDQVL